MNNKSSGYSLPFLMKEKKKKKEKNNAI